MTLPQFPPPIEMNNETKRAIIDGVKKVIEVFQSAGKLSEEISYTSLIHDPRDLYKFIKTFRNNLDLVTDIVIDRDGAPVGLQDVPLRCDVTLAQIQQLLVKTCAKRFLEEANKEDEKFITEKVTKKVLGVFSKTELVKRKVGGGVDERKVREISRQMAFDWQLPLLPAYNMLNSAQLFEVGDALACLQSFEAIKDYVALDQPTLKRAKAVVGDDFPVILARRPAALAGMGIWTRDMYLFYRRALGDSAFDFFCRDKDFFMICANLDKPLVSIYGDILSYIAGENLQELQRLNIDKTDVLLQGMKTAFGAKLRDALIHPQFAKDILRGLVESLQHVEQEKAQLVQSALITCKAMVPQVNEWLETHRMAAV